MTLFQYLSKDIDRVKLEVKTGQRPCTVIKDIQIYSRYDYYRKLGHTPCLGVMFTGEDLRVSERTVFRIIKKMEKEI
jgi:hypothetical protein